MGQLSDARPARAPDERGPIGNNARNRSADGQVLKATAKHLAKNLATPPEQALDAPTEKVSAEILRDMGLARFDLALCLTDKGKRVLAATRQANQDALKGL